MKSGEPCVDGLGMTSLESEMEVLARLRRFLAEPLHVKEKGTWLVTRVAGKNILDLGCVGHSLESGDALEGGQKWLHGRLSRSADTCLGVDLLKVPIESLASKGWSVICGDITNLDLKKKFDAIVAADVIEHIANLDGFFESVVRHMEPDSELIISTPNPFGLAHSIFIMLRGFPFVNTDHVHWFDPKTLIQVAGRFHLIPTELVWIDESWRVGDFLLHGSHRFGSYDFFSGRWSPLRGWKRVFRFIVHRIIFWPLNALVCSLRWRGFQSSDYVMVFRLKKSHSQDQTIE